MPAIQASYIFIYVHIILQINLCITRITAFDWKEDPTTDKKKKEEGEEAKEVIK